MSEEQKSAQKFETTEWLAQQLKHLIKQPLFSLWAIGPTQSQHVSSFTFTHPANDGRVTLYATIHAEPKVALRKPDVLISDCEEIARKQLLNPAEFIMTPIDSDAPIASDDAHHPLSSWMPLENDLALFFLSNTAMHQFATKNNYNVDCIEKLPELAPVDDRFKLPPPGNWSTKDIELVEGSPKWAVLDALVDQLDEHISDASLACMHLALGCMREQVSMYRTASILSPHVNDFYLKNIGLPNDTSLSYCSRMCGTTKGFDQQQAETLLNAYENSSTSSTNPSDKSDLSSTDLMRQCYHKPTDAKLTVDAYEKSCTLLLCVKHSFRPIAGLEHFIDFHLLTEQQMTVKLCNDSSVDVMTEMQCVKVPHEINELMEKAQHTLDLCNREMTTNSITHPFHLLRHIAAWHNILFMNRRNVNNRLAKMRTFVRASDHKAQTFRSTDTPERSGQTSVSVGESAGLKEMHIVCDFLEIVALTKEATLFDTDDRKRTNDQRHHHKNLEHFVWPYACRKRSVYKDETRKLPQECIEAHDLSVRKRSAECVTFSLTCIDKKHVHVGKSVQTDVMTSMITNDKKLSRQNKIEMLSEIFADLDDELHKVHCSFEATTSSSRSD